MTRVARTLLSVLAVSIGNVSHRRSDVLVQVVRRSRGGAAITINEGEVELTLSEGERIAFIEALGGHV